MLYALVLSSIICMVLIIYIVHHCSFKNLVAMPHLIVRPGAFMSRDHTGVVCDLYSTKKGKNEFYSLILLFNPITMHSSIRHTGASFICSALLLIFL